MKMTTGTDSTVLYLDWSLGVGSGDAERAHQLCLAVVKESPNGMIPIQTVYEMLLKMAGRYDILDEMAKDQASFDVEDSE